MPDFKFANKQNLISNCPTTTFQVINEVVVVLFNQSAFPDRSIYTKRIVLLKLELSLVQAGPTMKFDWLSGILTSSQRTVYSEKCKFLDFTIPT